MIRKIIFNIAVVAVVVFALDFVIGRTLRYFYFKQSSGSFFRGTYSMEITKADILVFGSSTAGYHYVPEVFEDALGGTFYNTGQNALGIFLQLATLNSVLKRYTPKIIILSWGDSFGKDKESYDQLSHLLPYYRKHEEIRRIVELRSPFERLKLISEVYPFNSQVFTILIRNLKIIKISDFRNKGYAVPDERWQGEADPVNTPVSEGVDYNKVAAFREFIVQAKESGAHTFVVLSPVFKKFKMLREVKIINKICAAEKVDFWDFSRNTLFYKNKSLFADIYHLNHDGAILFSKLIAAKIKDAINNNAP